MTQVCFNQLSNEWTSFEDMVGSGFSASATYELQNRGNGYILALESNTEPQPNNMAGLIIKPLDIFSYKKGTQTLYLRSLSSECAINTRSDEEMSEYAPNLIKKTITENGDYSAADEGVDGYSDVIVNVPIPEVSGQLVITSVAEVDVSQYETAIVEDYNLTPSNIKKDVEILGVTGEYEGEECTVHATNASNYDRLAGEKVWVKKVGDEWHIIDFADADPDTITGALLEDAEIGVRSEVKVMLDGRKTAHMHVPDFVDDGTPLPVIDYDEKTVTFSDMSQSIYKTANSIPTPQEIIEIVVKVKSEGTGERDYQGTGAYFFKGYTSSYELTPLIRVYCGNNLSISYNGTEFGGNNGHYDIVSSEDFQAGKFYWAKITFTDTTMTFYVSTDGINYNYVWENDFGAGVFNAFVSARKEFGFLPCKTGNLVDGEYGLDESYVRIDNTYVFQPMRPVQESY
jgi:hypothetical protein